MSEAKVVPFQQRVASGGKVADPNLPEPETHGQKVRAGRVEQAQKRMRVMELRAAGLTEDQIAAHLDMPASTVSRVITTTLEKWAERDQEHAQLIRPQKLFELDQLKRAVWQKAIQGDLKALREAVKIIALQARISGAEAPVQHEHSGTVTRINIDHEEVKRMEQAWLNSGGTVDGTATEVKPEEIDKPDG